MAPSRRTFLKSVGATAGTGALLSNATAPVAAHAKPPMVWRPASEYNYTYANRENDYPIRWYVVHATNSSYWSTINYFQDPSANASTHYVIENDNDPEITQMVDESNIAWHCGNNTWDNYVLGTEHDGIIGEEIWTDATYRRAARIAQWAGETYGFPLRVRRYNVAPCNPWDGAGGIIGHHQIPNPNDCSQSGGISGKTDPGWTWNWGKYEGYVRQFHVNVNEAVFANANLHVRDAPGTSSTVLDTAPAGTNGVVTDGPVDADGYRWFQVNYEGSTADGWSAATWLPYCRFYTNDWLYTSASLSVRDGPSVNNNRIDTAPAGTWGKVIDGPVDTDYYRWWKIDYDGASTGWSADYWLRD